MVYKRLNKDFEFLLRMRTYIHSAGILLFLYSGYVGFNDGYPFFLAGLYAFYWALNFNSDLVAQNWFMHSIDWRDNVKGKKFPRFRDSPTANE